VRAGTRISIRDSSTSFSPCYCAPEWARFLTTHSRSQIVADPALDVWSIGMTLCELFATNAILQPQYAKFARGARCSKEACFLFLEWLGGVRKAPVPKSVERHDEATFAAMITQWMLVPDHASRKTCAQALPYFALHSRPARIRKRNSAPCVVFGAHHLPEFGRDQPFDIER
jgi:serine/threonine protein kinase